MRIFSYLFAMPRPRKSALKNLICWKCFFCHSRLRRGEKWRALECSKQMFSSVCQQQYVKHSYTEKPKIQFKIEKFHACFPFCQLMIPPNVLSGGLWVGKKFLHTALVHLKFMQTQVHIRQICIQSAFYCMHT